MGPFKRLWGFAHTLVSYLLMSWRVCLSIRRWEGPSLTRCPQAHRSAQRRGDETCKCACLPFRSPTSPSRIPSHNRAVLRDGNNQQQSEPVWTGTGANGDVGVPQYYTTDLSKAVWRQNQNMANHSNILFNLNKFHQLGCVVVKKSESMKF